MIPNRDEVEGKWEQVKGTVKGKVGELTNDSSLEAEGDAQDAGGSIQEGYGTAKRKVGETIKDIGERVNN